LLPDRLTWIDDTNRDQHFFLEATDRCLFFSDFFGGRDWSAGYTNQLIKNYKRTPPEIAASASTKRLHYYKERAVNEVASALRKVFTAASVASRTFVPIPTSKIPADPAYCDRLERTLRIAFQGYDADLRLLLRQTVSTEADHRSGDGRRSYEELLKITQLDPQQLTAPPRAEIVLFDDVLTSGKHFRVATTRIREAYPDQAILGIFVARCIHGSAFADFEPRAGTSA
jgi:hypothetical protein